MVSLIEFGGDGDEGTRIELDLDLEWIVWCSYIIVKAVAITSAHRSTIRCVK